MPICTTYNRCDRKFCQILLNSRVDNYSLTMLGKVGGLAIDFPLLTCTSTDILDVDVLMVTKSTISSHSDSCVKVNSFTKT